MIDISIVALIVLALLVFFVVFVVFAIKKVKKKILHEIGSKMHNEIANDFLLFHMRFKLLHQKNSNLMELSFMNQELENFAQHIRIWSHRLYNNVQEKNIDHFIETKKIVNNLVKPNEKLNVILNYNWNEVDLIKVSTTTKTKLIYILKETLSNAIKHSTAMEIFIDFWKDNNSLIFRVEDSGTGFDVDNFKASVGMREIKNICRELNIKMEIDSFIGTGSSFTFKLNNFR